MKTDTHCYSRRLVSPWRGLLQIARMSGAVGLSLDGQHWEIQVSADWPNNLWGTPGARATRAFFRFGNWSPRRGLTKVPLNPILNNCEMIPAARTLVNRLEEMHSRVPFPQHDRYELWLLEHGSRRPLALLATAVERHPLQVPDAPRWQAVHGVTADADASGIAESAMEAAIRSAAGDPAEARWFLRDAPGQGVGVEINLQSGAEARRLSAAGFPELPWREGWQDRALGRLALAYSQQRAAQLLALQHLRNMHRHRLEQAARKEPLQVERLWRLYPNILNRSILISARVEARMRLAGD